jgi:(p)ppGpp synthase/HD superfamily hydrolase
MKDPTLLSRAVFWAAELHRDQWRDGETPLPYITHPLEVLALLRHVGQVTDMDMLCAAALHDAIEETHVTREEIAATISVGTADLVQELTRYEPSASETKSLSKSEIWNLRSKFLLEEIKTMSPRAQQIKLADRLSNLRGALQTKKGEKLKRYATQTERILQIVPESVNPALWQAIQEELSRNSESIKRI